MKKYILMMIIILGTAYLSSCSVPRQASDTSQFKAVSALPESVPSASEAQTNPSDGAIGVITLAPPVLDYMADDTLTPYPPHVYDYPTASIFLDGYAVVKASDGEYGYINPDGKLLGGKLFAYALPFSDGMAEVWIQSSAGNRHDAIAFIDTSGEIVMSSYNGVSFSSNYTPNYFWGGFTTVSKSISGYTNSPSAVIDKDGNTVLPFDSINNYCYFQCGDGTLIFRCTDGENQTLMDTSGNVLAEFPGMDVGVTFTDGVSAYSYNDAHSKNGLIDMHGNIITQPIFNNVGRYNDGVAPAQDIYGQYGYINTKGQFIFKDTTGTMNYLWGEWDNTTENDNVIVVGSSLYSSIDGHLIAKTEMDTIGRFSWGVAACKKDGKYGLIDAQGNIIAASEWQASAFNYSQGLVVIVQNGKMGVLQITGLTPDQE